MASREATINLNLADLPQVKELLAAANARIGELLDLLREFVWDDDDCRYDHHGYCQQHSLGERPCPHERAKAILTPRPLCRQPWRCDQCGARGDVEHEADASVYLVVQAIQDAHRDAAVGCQFDLARVRVEDPDAEAD